MSERSGREIDFASNGDTVAGYLATPASGRGPGVIVIQEWWGLVDHIRDVCDRLAREGFVALAPDLFRGEATKPSRASRSQTSRMWSTRPHHSWMTITPGPLPEAGTAR